MSHDVQQYDVSVFHRAEEARRCHVHSALFMPLFSSPAREHPLAVFEVAQMARDTFFPALVDGLVACLQVMRSRNCPPKSGPREMSMAAGAHSAIPIPQNTHLPFSVDGTRLTC